MRWSNLHNSVWSVFDVLLYPALYLLFTPFMMQQMGEKVYGLWVLANTIVVFMQVYNFGLGVNTLRNIALSIGKRDNGNIPLVLRTNFTLALLLGLLSTGSGLMIAWGTGYFNWFDLPPRLQSTAVAAISLTGILAGLKFIESVLVNVLNAYERIALVARYNTLVRLAGLAAALGLIFARAGIQYIFLLTILVYIAGLLLLYYFVLKTTGYFRLRLMLEPAFIRKEIRYSKWIWMQQVLVILAFQCDKFLVAYWVGVAPFSYYSIVATIFSHIHLALIAIAPWAMPQMAKRLAAGAALKDYYFSFRSLVHVVAFLGMLIFYLLYDQVFRLWLGAEITAHLAAYLRLYMAFELFFVLTIASYFLFNSSGKERLATLNTFIYTICSLTGLAAGYYYTHTINGMLQGMILAMFIAMIIQQWFVSRMLQVRFVPESLGLLSPMLLLSLFILSEQQPLLCRAILLILSLILFVYVYFYIYPVRFSLLQPVKT